MPLGMSSNAVILQTVVKYTAVSVTLDAFKNKIVFLPMTFATLPYGPVKSNADVVSLPNFYLRPIMSFNLPGKKLRR